MTASTLDRKIHDRLIGEARRAQLVIDAFNRNYRGRSSGPTCEDGKHGLKCLFGRDHVWSVWYEQALVVRTDVTYHCHTCGAVCTAEETV